VGFCFLLSTLPTLDNIAFAAAERGALVRVANIYLSPDTNSAKLAEIERGGNS